MKTASNEKQRTILLATAWVLTAGVSFGLGTMLTSKDTLPTEVAAAGKGATGTQAGTTAPSETARERVGGVFSAEGGGKAASPATVGEITGGQPLDEWLKRLMAQEDDLFRMQNFMKLLESLDNVEDVKTALKVVMQNGGGGRGRGPGGGRFTEIAMLMSKFVQLDPKAAITYATEQEGGEKFMATATALRTWARISPDAALEWARTDGAKVQMDFGRGPGGGEEGQPQENFSLMSVVSQLARTDLDKALSNAASMEVGRMGGRMVETLASELVSQRGADAARAYAGGLPAGAYKDEMLQQVAERLGQKDPKGTADWVMAMETGDAKRRSLGRVMDSWAGKDAAAAGTYLTALPPGPDTDSARSEYVNVVARTNGATAWQWAQTITDAERQQRAAVTAAQNWVRQDQAAATAAINASAYSDGLKKEMLTPRSGGGGGFDFRRRGN